MTAWTPLPPAGALMLGSEMEGTWFTPMRPPNVIDYRNLTALKHDWNRSDFILDASLVQGATIFVRRAGPQTET